MTYFDNRFFSHESMNLKSNINDALLPLMTIHDRSCISHLDVHAASRTYKYFFFETIRFYKVGQVLKIQVAKELEKHPKYFGK